MNSALSTSGGSYYKNGNISFTDGDSFNFKGNKSVRLVGVDAPERAHSEDSVGGNLFAQTNRLFSQRYSKEATDYANKFANSKGVEVSYEGVDDKGRRLARLTNSQGQDLSKELIKEGLAHAYTSGRFVDRKTWEDTAVQQAFADNVISGKGIYADKEYVNPGDYKHGGNALTSNSRASDLKIAYAIKANERMAKDNIGNPSWAPLYDQTGTLGYLLAPSKLGSSYHYGVALHNVTMRQAGLENHITTGGNVGIGEVLYRMGSQATGKGPSEYGLAISKQYDKELYQQGVGDWFNEHFALPQGYGRLYKDEVGFIPSLLGGFGAMLDKSYLYYTSNTNAYQDQGQNYRDSLGYKPLEEPTGLFQAAFEKGANFAISAASALGLYLVAGEPVNLLLSEGLKAKEQANLDTVFSTAATRRADWVGQVFGGVADNSITRVTTLGHKSEYWSAKSPTDLKYQFVKNVLEAKDAGESVYSVNNFSLTTYHFNTVFFREKAAILLENTIKPFASEYINPFTPGTANSDNFMATIDDFIAEVRRPADINLTTVKNSVVSTPDIKDSKFTGEFKDVRMYQADHIIKHIEHSEIAISNLKEDVAKTRTALRATPNDQALLDTLNTKQAQLSKLELGFPAQKEELMNSIQTSYSNVGTERQSIVAQKLQRMLEVIPLNPFRWRMLGGINNDTNYTKVGSIFSFEEASAQMQKVLFSKGGLSSLIENSTVIRQVDGPNGTKKFVKDTLGTIENVFNQGIKKTFAQIGEYFGRPGELSKLSRQYQKAEQALLENGQIGWDGTSGRTAQVVGGDATELLETVGEYENYIKKNGGLNTDQMIRASEHAKDLGISKLNAKAGSSLGESAIDKSKGKLGLIAAALLFTTISVNNLVESTGGTSLVTQILYANANANEDNKVSTNFAGNRLFDAGGMWQNAGITTLGTLGTLAVARNVSMKLRKEGFKTYSLDDMAMQNMIVSDTADAKGNYWRLDEVKEEREIKYILSKMQTTVGEAVDRSKSIAESGHKQLTQINVWKKQSVGYQIAAGVQLINDGNVGRNTLIGATVGILAFKGLLSAGANLLNTSRENVGTVDPLIAAVGVGVAVGFKTRNYAMAALGGIAAAAVTGLANLAELKLFKIGGKGDEVSLQAQTAGQLQLYANSIINKPGATELEIQAGFYASEMSKLINVYSKTKGRGETQVIAKQVPLPFIQFFLAKSIKGQQWNGDVLNKERTTSSYSVGIQSSPLLGTSLSIQLPIKISTDTSTGVFGISYNEETNLVDIWKGGIELNAAGFLALTVPAFLTKKASQVANKYGFTAIADNLEGTSKGLNTLGRIANTASELVNDVFLNTIHRTATSLFRTDYDLSYKIAAGKTGGVVPGDQLEASSQLRTKAKFDFINKHYIGKGVIFGVVAGTLASIAYNVASDGKQNDVIGTGIQAAVGLGTGLGYMYLSYQKDLYNLNKRNRHLAEAAAGLLQNPLSVGDHTFKDSRKPTKFNDEQLKGIGQAIAPKATWMDQVPEGLKKFTKRNAMVAAAVAAATYLATDSKFGISTGMDTKLVYQDVDKLIPSINDNGQYRTEEDPTHRWAVIGAMTAIATPVLTYAGRFGITPSETLTRYSDLLKHRQAVIAGTAQATDRSWLNRHVFDKLLEQDAQYIIESAGKQLKHIKDFDSDLGTIALKASGIVKHVHVGAKPVNATAEFIEESVDIHGITYKNVSESIVSAIDGDKGIANLINNTPVLLDKVRSKFLYRKAGVVGAGLAIAGYVIGGLATRGNSDNTIVDNFFLNLDKERTKGGLLGGVAGVIADVTRLVSGRDYVDISAISGREFGRTGTVLKTGKSLINAKTAQYNGFVKSLTDIRSMFVFDEPNAFFSLGAVGGTTFRPGEKGTRNTYYWQLQSAGQDVSTSVYSLAATFAFKEVAAGLIQQGLLTDLAVKDAFKQNGTTNSELIAAKILNVTATTQHLKKRRKFSKIADSVLDIAARDSILADIITQREQSDAHMSYQPAASLFSQMLQKAYSGRKDGSKAILKALHNSSPETRKDLLKKLYGDKYGNRTRQSRIKNVTIFGQDKAGGKGSGTSAQFDDDSQWSSTASLSGSTQTNENDRNVFSNIQYLFEPLSQFLPGIFGSALALGAVAVGVGGILGFAGHLSLNEEVAVVKSEVIQGYSSQYGYKGKEGISFEIKPRTLPDGSTIPVAPDTPRPTVTTTSNTTVTPGNRHTYSPLDSDVVKVGNKNYVYGKDGFSRQGSQAPNLNKVRDQVEEQILQLRKQQLTNPTTAIGNQLQKLQKQADYLNKQINEVKDAWLNKYSYDRSQKVVETITEISEAGIPRVANPVEIEVVSGSKRFRFNSSLIDPTDNRLLAQINTQTRVIATKMGNIFDSGFNGRSFTDHMLSNEPGNFIDEITDMVADMKTTKGTTVNQLKDALSGKFEAQANTVADRVFGTVTEVDGVQKIDSSKSVLGNVDNQIDIDGKKYFLHELFDGEQSGSAEYKLLRLRNEWLANNKTEVGNLLDTHLRNSGSRANKQMGEELVKNINTKDLSSQMKKLTGDVLKGLFEGNGLKVLREQLGGTLQAEDVQSSKNFVHKAGDLLNQMRGVTPSVSPVALDTSAPTVSSDPNIKVTSTVNGNITTTITIHTTVGGRDNRPKLGPDYPSFPGNPSPPPTPPRTPGGLPGPGPAPTTTTTVTTTQTGGAGGGKGNGTMPANYDAWGPDPGKPLNALPDQGGSSPIIKRPHGKIEGRAGLMSSAFKAFQGLMFVADMFNAVDIMSSTSRLANAYVNPYASTSDVDMAKKEFGMTVTNTVGGVAIGVGVTWGVGAAVAFAAATPLAPLIVGGALAILIAGGLFAVAKNGIQPVLESVGKKIAPIFKPLGNIYERVSDGVGEVLGGTIPNAVGNVLGPRGRSGTAFAIGGAIAFGAGALGVAAMGAAATTTGMTAASLLGLGVMSGGTLFAFMAIGAAVGLLAGTIAPKESAAALTNFSRALYKVPFIGAMLATDPNNQLLAQSRFRKHWRGSPVTFGTAKDVIQQEFANTLNISEDYTGKATASSFIDSSLHGYGGFEDSFSTAQTTKAGGMAASWAIIRPKSIVSNQLQREFEIKAQNFNQAVVGSYNWKSRLRRADNYSAIMKQEAQMRNYKRNILLAESAKQMKAVQRVTPVGTAHGKLTQEQINNKAVYVAAITEQIIRDEESSKQTKAVSNVTVKGKNINNPARENIEQDMVMVLGKQPVPQTNKQVKVTMTKHDDGTTVKITKSDEKDAMVKELTTQSIITNNSNPLTQTQLQTNNIAAIS